MNHNDSLKIKSAILKFILLLFLGNTSIISFGQNCPNCLAVSTAEVMANLSADPILLTGGNVCEGENSFNWSVTPFGECHQIRTTFCYGSCPDEVLNDGNGASGSATLPLGVTAFLCVYVECLQDGEFPQVVWEMHWPTVTTIACCTTPQDPIISSNTNDCSGTPGSWNVDLDCSGNSYIGYSITGGPPYSTEPPPWTPFTTLTAICIDFSDNTCVSNPSSATATETECCADLTLSCVSENPTCNMTNGSAMAMGMGSDGNYTYTWSNGMTGSAINNIGAGDYTVTVTDGNNCQAECMVSLMDSGNGLTSVSCVSTDDFCSSGIGTATVTPNNGTPPYMYLWQNGQMTATATGLVGGNLYTVTVTDANGCMAICGASIMDSPGPSVSCVGQDPNCGASDGEATATPNGGTFPYTYLWSDGQDTQTAVGLSAGDYSVTIMDANGCQAECSQMLMSVGSITASCSGTNPACETADGTAIASPSGGLAPYTYLWDDPLNQTTATAINLGAGTFTVMISDANGCMTMCETTLVEPGGVMIDVIVDNEPSCMGNDGQASATANGGAPPYNYEWSDGQITATAINLSAGMYTVTATDGNNCAAVGSITLTDLSGPMADCSIVSEPSCGSADGSLTVEGSGGTSPYVYEWSDGQTTQTAVGLVQGTYTVTLTDANGCQAFCMEMLMDPNPPMILTEASCDPDNLTYTVTIMSNTADEISYDAGTLSGVAGDWTISGLNAGVPVNITVSVLATGCSASAQENADCSTSCNVLVMASSSNPTCLNGVVQQNGLITLSNFTDELYQFSTGASFDGGSAEPAAPTVIPISGIISSTLSGGNYTVRIYDATCFEDRNIFLTDPDCESCIITITTSEVGPCDNKGTLTDPSDDTYTVTVNASATNTGSSTQFIVNDGLTDYGPFDYGIGGVITDLPANDETITLTFLDAEDQSCTAQQDVTQSPCSDACIITITSAEVGPCDNKGTLTDPTDDIFSVIVNASALNVDPSSQFVVSDGNNEYGPFDYGVGGLITNLSANGATITLIFTDFIDSNCPTSIDVLQNPCSLCPTNNCFDIKVTKEKK